MSGLGIGHGQMVAGALPATPPRLGLLASAPSPDLTADGGWLNGLVFAPEAAIGSGAAPDDLSGYTWWRPGPGKTVDPLPTKTIGERPDLALACPYGIVEADTWPMQSVRSEDYVGRVTRLCAANLSRKLELELWTGAVSAAGDLGNNCLTSTDGETLTGGRPVTAMAQLQRYLTDTINGRGMIHCTSTVAAYWHAWGLIRREGNLVLDLHDNIVVVGSGYTGTAPGDADPAAGVEWAYATGVIQTLVDSLMLNPDTLDAALDRSTNLVIWRAERAVMAWWDNIALAGTPVTIQEP